MSQKKALINIERKIGSFCAFLKAKRADLLNFHLRQKVQPTVFLKSLLFGVELAEKSSVPPPPPPPRYQRHAACGGEARRLYRVHDLARLQLIISQLRHQLAVRGAARFSNRGFDIKNCAPNSNAHLTKKHHIEEPLLIS